jgi:hypothetical protein
LLALFASESGNFREFLSRLCGFLPKGRWQLVVLKRGLVEAGRGIEHVGVPALEFGGLSLRSHRTP